MRTVQCQIQRCGLAIACKVLIFIILCLWHVGKQLVISFISLQLKQCWPGPTCMALVNAWAVRQRILVVLLLLVVVIHYWTCIMPVVPRYQCVAWLSSAYLRHIHWTLIRLSWNSNSIGKKFLKCPKKNKEINLSFSLMQSAIERILWTPVLCTC